VCEEEVRLLTTSCRQGLIDESDGKLDLLVEARQPTCSCDTKRSITRLPTDIKVAWTSGEDRGGAAHRTMNAGCSPSALSVKIRE
jgi:hypothetical protein